MCKKWMNADKLYENARKITIIKRYGNYYWEQIKKLSESYYNDLEERVREIEEKDQRIAELEQELAEYKKYKEWQEQLDCKNADELIDFVMSNYLTEDEKCKTIKELNKQLAELKEKAIVPKFKVGQECYYVYTKSQLRPFNVKIGRITFDTDRKNKIIYDSDFEDDDSYFEKYYGMKECNLFATEQEAIEKLKEIQGNE